MTQYFLGQGKFYGGLRTAGGLPIVQRWLGDVSNGTLALKVDTIKHKESYSGQLGTAKKITMGKEASLDLTMMELSQENLALLLCGTASAIASGSVTAESLPDGLLAGDRVALKYMQVSDVVITDSAAVPAVLSAANYEVDPVYGAITLLDVTAATQPFKAAYIHAALDSLSVFSAAPKEIFVRYEGINLAEDGAPLVLELYRLSTEPLKELTLLGTKLAEMKFSAEVLIDTARPVDPEMGQFGRILRPTAP